MATVVLGDATLYYEDSGRGEPLPLVPGLSGRGSFWASQVADFARDFRVIVHDHRGTGRSTHSRIRYSEELASRIPGAKLVVLDGGGHGVPGIDAAAYNAAVGAFLHAQR
jgi:pimeloyl-ACP methyl ester carboxylesterase